MQKKKKNHKNFNGKVLESNISLKLKALPLAEKENWKIDGLGSKGATTRNRDLNLVAF